MADKDKKRISFSTEVIILWCALGLMVFAACEFFWWQATGFFEVENAGDQSSQLLILTLGAIGAACGLILAARRSAKFSEQVDTGQKQADTAQDQLFNEQLGRGAELLTRTEMVMRRTGIRVLEDLAETTIDNPDQVKFIMRIIHDFVHEKTNSPSKDKERLDIVLGIRTLVSLYNEVDKSDDSDGFRRLLNFSLCHLEGLNFTETELQGASFMGAKLQEARFMDAKLQGASFVGAELEGANFDGAELEGANFDGAELEGANFIGAELEWANFFEAELEGASFIAAKLEGANFDGAELEGANFFDAKLQGANFIAAKLQEADINGAKLQWADCTRANFSNAENLKEDQIKGMIFQAKNQPILPKGLEQFLDKRRSYEFKKDPDDKSNPRRCFVKSDAEWSEKDVDEWVAKYLASIRGLEDAG